MKIIFNQNGRILLENLIALVLLSSVLLILSNLSLSFMNKSGNDKKIYALALGQSQMEKTLSQKKFDNITVSIDKKWRINQRITNQNEKNIILIEVYYKDTLNPVVKLCTIR